MPATISRGNKLIVMRGRNYCSLSFSLNELMNDKIDIESQFKSKLKQYRISLFYNTFLQQYNIGCVNDIAMVDISKLKSIENDIFSFGKNRLKQKQFEKFIRHVTLRDDYKIDTHNKIAPKSNIFNHEKKEDNISQFEVSTAVSPTFTATTLITQFDSSISINTSTVRNGDTILLGSSVANTLTTIDPISDTASNYYNNNNDSSNQATLSTTTELATQFDSSINKSTNDDSDSITLGGSVANTHITRDTIIISDTFTNYNSNNNGSSNQAQYFESYQESQSQSQSHSMGIQYQPPWPSVATSVVGTNDSMLMHNFANTSNYSGSVLSFNT